MNIEQEILEIKRSQQRIDSKLTALLTREKSPTKETWVKVSFITDLTGWDREKMRTARETGIIRWRRSKETGIEYDLDSLNEKFIIKKTA